MRKRFTGQVGVDEGPRGADLVQTEPTEQELGFVLHKERDNLAPFDTLGQ